ncbi:MAG: DUF3368 domain-containing protein [Chloroflexota bacterium]
MAGLSHFEKLVLLDNTVLSNFALVRRTDLITGIWKNCATTPQAWQEFQQGVLNGKSASGMWKRLQVISLSEVEIAFCKTLPKMGAGERSCLAVAHYRQAIFATDDAKARAVGAKLGLEISGTIGFLLFAINIQAVTLHEANFLLNKMIETGYRSPVRDLSEI